MNNHDSRPPRWLLALGAEELPVEIRISGSEYRFLRPFKHDFFAATALYESDQGKVVLKVGRKTSLFGIPTNWIGKLLCGHEARLLKLTQGIAGIPKFVGYWGPTGLAHEFVEGQPLKKGDRPGDDFFPKLSKLLEDLHRLEVAYVDLEKPENVLVGEDGNPYLFDFQISWHLPANRLGRCGPAKWVLGILQGSDRYHLFKHWRKLRPDQLDASVLNDARHIPIWIRWHRGIFRPITLFRRQILVWMGVRSSIRVRSPG
jgi:hypothetical protein